MVKNLHFKILSKKFKRFLSNTSFKNEIKEYTHVIIGAGEFCGF